MWGATTSKLTSSTVIIAIIIVTWCCSCNLGVQLARPSNAPAAPRLHHKVGSHNEEGRSVGDDGGRGGGGRTDDNSSLLQDSEDEETIVNHQRTLRSVVRDDVSVVVDDDEEALESGSTRMTTFDEKRGGRREDMGSNSDSSNRTRDASRNNNNNNDNNNSNSEDDGRSTEVMDSMYKSSSGGDSTERMSSGGDSATAGGGAAGSVIIGDGYDGQEPLEPVTLVPPTSEPIVPSRGDQEEKILLQYLMRGYERDVRPVRNSSVPVVVEVGITLTQIFDMDEKNQVLTTNVWLDQEWYDELLRWDPVDFGGLESIRLPCERIWLPDIVLYNNADDYTAGYMPSRAMVSHNGKVFWPPPTKFRSTCPVDVTYFPFDDQICTLKLGSWTYNGFQVDVMNRTAEVDLSNYVANGEWELLEADLQRNVVYYSCCPEPFPDVTITLIIRRKTLYYIYNIVLPCVMLSVLTLLVFCLPPDSGEKIALGVTVLLAFSVFMLAIAEKMPETSESIPLIGIYLTAVMAITSVSVIVTVVVLNLHYLGPQVHAVPPWLRRFLPKDRRCRPGAGGAEAISSIRQRSWLIPPTHREPRSGSLKRAQFLLPPNRLSIDSYTGQPLNSTRSGDHHLQYHHHHLHHHVPLEGMDMIKKPLKECSSTESMTNDNAVAGNFGKSSRSSINYHLHSSSHNTTSSGGSGGGGGSSSLHQRHASKHTKGLSTTNLADTGKDLPTVSDSSVDISTLPMSNTTRNGGNGGGGEGDVQEELLRSIRHLIGRQEEVEAQNLMVAEWRLVAQAVDRILFWIFTLVTVVSSAVFLLILPFYKRSWYGPTPPAAPTVSPPQ